MKSIFASLLAIALAATTHAADRSAPTHVLQLLQPGKVLVSDDFTKAEMPSRRLTRGEWTVKDGLAACAHNEELFKQ